MSRDEGEPMAANSDATTLGAAMARRAGQVEACLAALLSGPARPGAPSCPERLLAAMRHAALDGGKRLRPFLLMECAALGGDDEARRQAALRAAAALELVHCYSLVHDDLPAMDDDDLRRGRPTVHKAFDEATAILAGDALLTLAFEVLADPATHADAALRAALVLDLARAAGPAGMVGGQMLDLEAEKPDARTGRPRRLGESEIGTLQAMKTGALIGHACRAGARIAGLDDQRAGALATYGALVGRAFQLADDLLDATATPEATGKRTGKDAARGKATLVALYGIGPARSVAEALASQAVAALAPFDHTADALREAARYIVTRPV